MPTAAWWCRAAPRSLASYGHKGSKSSQVGTAARLFCARCCAEGGLHRVDQPSFLAAALPPLIVGTARRLPAAPPPRPTADARAKERIRAFDEAEKSVQMVSQLLPHLFEYKASGGASGAGRAGGTTVRRAVPPPRASCLCTSPSLLPRRCLFRPAPLLATCCSLVCRGRGCSGWAWWLSRCGR